MSERKVLNKYIPPDFDPSKIPKRVKAKNEQHKVRLMAPFSMHCITCGNWIAKSTKFNARKETVEGEMYLTIKIFRFYIRCPRCSAEITFKTDPKSADYVCEHGALRNFDSSREERLITEEMKQEREQQEENNPMKALENRTLESKKEMEILDALDEIRTRNARSERLSIDEVNERLLKRKQQSEEDLRKAEEEEIERIAKATFKNENGETIRRLVIEGDNREGIFEEKIGEINSAGFNKNVNVITEEGRRREKINNDNSNNNGNTTTATTTTTTTNSSFLLNNHNNSSNAFSTINERSKNNNNNNNSLTYSSTFTKKRSSDRDLLKSIVRKKPKTNESETESKLSSSSSTITQNQGKGIINNNDKGNTILKKSTITSTSPETTTTATTTTKSKTSSVAPLNPLSNLLSAYGDSDSDSDSDENSDNE